MKKSNFVRFSGFALILAALVRLGSGYVGIPEMVGYGIVLIGSLLGFLGFYQYQKDEANVVGLLSVITLLGAFVFYGVGQDGIGDITFRLSFLVLAVACWQANKIPRWVSATLGLVVILRLLMLVLPELPNIIDTVSESIGNITLLLLGYYLVSERG